MPKTKPAARPPAAGARRSPAAAAAAPKAGSVSEATATVGAPSRWRPWTAFVVSLAAFGVSFYLTLVHFDSSGIRLLCSGSGTVNCEAVTTSPQSMVFGVFPVALLGLIFYTGMLVLNLPVLWRSRWRAVAPLRLAAVVTGMGMVLYLLYAELFQIHAICIYCTVVHALTFILFILVVTGWEDATAATAGTGSAV